MGFVRSPLDHTHKMRMIIIMALEMLSLEAEPFKILLIIFQSPVV